ncbi:hypothetical protein C8Q80DRAFT_1273069 [Daedaleopsis nitida]|nr:hypothetical protein C8Q80DRAFT_1273069 [Daedaleopsis nitida]
MSGRVTRKRARMAEAEEAAQQEPGQVQDQADEAGGLRRDEHFWFEDGSIILHARDVAFKVYAKPLIDHSPVFKDMLSLPQPDDGVSFQSAGRNIPVVSLADAPEDLRHVFEVIMPTKTLRPFGFESTSYHTISAWIRLGHKYQIHHLVERSLAHLRRFPRLHAIGVVNLARITEAYDLIPTALMSCCMLDAGIAIGFPREDGSMERLCAADIELCFKAKENLIEARVQLLHHIADSVLGSCCEDQVQTFVDEMARGRKLCIPQPFWINLASFKKNRPGLCKSCTEELSKSCKEERRKVFDRLPALVGITVDGWGQPKAATIN